MSTRALAGASPRVLPVRSAAARGRYSPGSRRAYGDRSGRQDDTIEADGDLGVERDRLDGRSRAEQQPPLFSTIQVCPKDPAAPCTDRLEVRQTDCANGGP